MMVERAARFELYGAVRLYERVRVLELYGVGAAGDGVHVVTPSLLEEEAPRLAVVVPVKNDELLTLEGVISGIPHASPVIIVSASDREPVDRYRHELELARLVHERTGRQVMVLHQRDPAWRRALEGTPLESLLGEDGLVRYGKGEGMLLGLLAAAWLGARYVGFIDSDNYVPGSVSEYAVAYIAGFTMASSPRSMVRIKWPYKGKIAGVPGDVYLRRRGRVSMHTNRVLNLAISLLRGVETDIVQTANSGEHALTVELGLEMEWAGGFAVEPYQLVSLLEGCWLRRRPCPSGGEGIDILQVETRNPHLHAERGEEHLVSMLATSLGTVYHSSLAQPRVREEIVQLLREQGYQGEPPKPRVYPPPGRETPRKAMEALLAESRDTLVLPER